MNKYLELHNFNIRWNINFTDKDKLNSLKEKINVILQKNIGFFIEQNSFERKFLELKGSKIIPQKEFEWGKVRKEKNENKIIKALFECEDELELFKTIQILFILSPLGNYEKNKLKEELEVAIFSSGYSNIVKIEERNKTFLVLPVGEKFLDKNLINKSIKDISNYKTAYKIFIDSLEKYSGSKNTGVENIQIINSLRTSFENYLKEKFNTDTRSIDNIATKIVGPYLAEKNIDVNIRTMYINLAKSIEKFNNDNIKHTANLEISKEEVELFIYLTGTLVRFLESLK